MLLSGRAWQDALAMAAIGLGILPHMRPAAAGMMLVFAVWAFWMLAYAGISLGVHGWRVI